MTRCDGITKAGERCSRRGAFQRRTVGAEWVHSRWHLRTTNLCKQHVEAGLVVVRADAIRTLVSAVANPSVYLNGNAGLLRGCLREASDVEVYETPVDPNAARAIAALAKRVDDHCAALTAQAKKGDA